MCSIVLENSYNNILQKNKTITCRTMQNAIKNVIYNHKLNNYILSMLSVFDEILYLWRH